jgi:hypothetical protein
MTTRWTVPLPPDSHDRVKTCRGKTLGGGCTSADHLPTKRQQRSDGLWRLLRQQAFGHRLFPLPMVVLGNGPHMPLCAMGGIVMAMDGPIHVLPVPMMREPTLLDL